MLDQAAFIIFGCIIGSFLTVCIYRIPFASLEAEEALSEGEEPGPDEFSFPTAKAPFKDLTVNNPRRSFCPNCHKQLMWYHNIPVLSWLFLRGKCAHCSAKISVRYPLTEIAAGLISWLTFTNFGVTYTGAAIFIFACALLVIMVIDYDYYIIPNVISLPGTAICFLIAAVNQFFHIFTYPIVPGILDSVYGILAGAGFLFVVSEFYLRVRKIEGLGMGDVKLLAMTGAFLGPQCSLFTIFVGSLIGALSGLAMIVISRRRITHPLPFGPYLASATLLYIYGGEDIALKIMESVAELFN